ncbi:cytochrome P450, family 87, subfamily A, polypeptide 6 [Actinidia rufa]|uniref:Cytochrome P450, family 87, subfamily A, polypeptide 6 n=1 Tax=Actinidia rufa TaxID=165716 RepID=A0A7J0DZ62_9ERIC|nr:cytochrome P450, family 87, subfamily A, polypeptide 6 [Actinidia rufa]
MDTWFIILIALCIPALLKSLIGLFIFSREKKQKKKKKKKKLPPGPITVPLIGNFLWLRKSTSDLEPILRNLRDKYGPIITLRIGSRPAIFVASHKVAHHALVHNGALFSDRPKALPAGKVLNSNQHNISSATYGPTWRTLRRNLTSEILHPSRVKSYSGARRWVLGILIHRLVVDSTSSQVGVGEGVKVVDHFQYAMFCLLVLMCFGDRLQEKQIKEIETVQRQVMLSFSRFNILNFWPSLGKIVFRNRWKELLELRQNQEKVLIPLIISRMELVKQRQQQQQGEQDDPDPQVKEKLEDVVAYVDTLVDLELPDEKRKLEEGEMVSLCHEFLNAGTDTTSTALQWIMANLVKYPTVQAKLYQEINGVMGPPPRPPSNQFGGEESLGLMLIEEEDLQRMVYLKAVVLEGLRRHPPAHFVVPHSVTRDVELDGYLIPKDATINFMVAEIGWDPKLWDHPMDFNPDRFLQGQGQGSMLDMDITGSREIKMMPFGAGRRICPGFNLALLHLELFVANLIWYFQWTPAPAHDPVDLSEKQEFTIVMKNPLHAHLIPRHSTALPLP